MSGIYLESAYYGDEKSFANITKGLATKIIGGVLDVTSNSDLKPVFEAAPVTKLDPKDERELRQQAVNACGGEADQSCLERTQLKLSQERLREKENESLVKGVIKGDRLTVNIVDNGRRRTLIAPAGQKLRLENIIGDKPSDKNAILALPSSNDIQDRAISLLTVLVGTFFWVFGIVASYTIFMRQYEATGKDSFRMIAYVSAGLSVLFPGLGYVIILGYFGFNAFIAEYIAQ
jgi:hypothetical protein